MADATTTDATKTADATKTSDTSAAPWHSDWAKPDGTLNAESYKRLPEDVRWVGETLSKYKTADDLARGVANLTTAVGKKGLIPLPANAPPEAVAERKALLDGINGVPKEAKDYGLTRPAEVPEGAWDPAYVEKVAGWAQKHSVGPAAMKELLNGVVATQVKGQIAAQETARTTFLADQDKAFDEQIRLDAIPREKADALAERAAVSLGFDMTKPEQAGLLQYAAVKLAMLRHAIAVGEDHYVAGETAKGEGGDAMALANDALTNPANPYFEVLKNPQHPQFKMVAAKMDGWFRQAAAKMAKSQT